MTSPSLRSSSPRRNGSVTNFESPVRRGTSIRTITQSASRSDIRAAGPSRSPAVSVRQKHRYEHIPNRFDILTGNVEGCQNNSTI